MRTTPTHLTLLCACACVLSAALASCGISLRDNDPAPPPQAGQPIHQEGAPYPADMEHLDQILSLIDEPGLPEGAHVTSLTPATKFAEAYPGGWGYVIAFTAEEDAIRDYMLKRNGDDLRALDKYHVTSLDNLQLADIDLTQIKQPWDCGIGGDVVHGSGRIVLERPLGRAWLQIRGAPR